jgi:large subunit ribosomal protein L21
MFVVIKTGGKQYRVHEGDIIHTELIGSPSGRHVDIASVLMIGDADNVKIGTPLIDGAHVSAEVLDNVRDRKVIVFKKIRRHNYRRKRGHRQHLSILRINEIHLPQELSGLFNVVKTPALLAAEGAIASAESVHDVDQADASNAGGAAKPASDITGAADTSNAGGAANPASGITGAADTSAAGGAANSSGITSTADTSAAGGAANPASDITGAADTSNAGGAANPASDITGTADTSASSLPIAGGTGDVDRTQ